MKWHQLSTTTKRGLDRAPSSGLVLVAAISVQAGAAIATKLFHAVGPGGAVLLRLSAASLCLGIVTRPAVRDHGPGKWAVVVAFAVSLAGLSYCFYNAIERIPLGIAVTIQFLGPLVLAIVGSRRRRDIVWIGLALLGVIALGHGDPQGLDTTGVIYAVLTAAMFVAFIVLGQHSGRAFEGTGGLALALGLASLIALPTGIIDGGSQLVSARSLGLGLAVGALSTALPYACEIEALRRIDVTIFGVLISLEPAIAALAGLVILGEGVTLRSAIGIALVTIASAGASIAPPGRRRDPQRR